MPTFVSGSSKTFTPAPAGTHQAVCVDVIDKGMQETQYGLKRKVVLRWQIDELMDNGKRFLVQKQYTASLNEKAVLRHDLAAWRGRDFTESELAQFDLDSVIGANCILSVAHRPDAKGNIWANVMTVSPLMKGMTKMAVADYVMDRDREPEQPTAGDVHDDDRHVETPSDDDIPF